MSSSKEKGNIVRPLENGAVVLAGELDGSAVDALLFDRDKAATNARANPGCISTETPTTKTRGCVQKGKSSRHECRLKASQSTGRV